MDPANITYEDGVCIHTDPATGFQYKWNSDENKWEPRTAASATTNQSDDEPKYELVGNTYVYKDKSGQTLEWDVEKKEWKPKNEKVPKKRVHNSEEEFDSEDSADDRALEQKKADMSYNVQIDSDGVKTYRDPTDGTIYEWDGDKKAWFPKLDEEFIARYQLSYGGSEPKVEEPVKVEEASAKPEKKQPSQPSWFEIDESKNTKVYVTNLPSDITEQEFVDFMQKCGMVEKDLDSGKFKIKIYKDENGEIKGDALCTYIKVESVELALNILDGSTLKGRTISVERAKFTLKGEYDPTKKPRKRKKKDIEKMKKKQEKLFEWRPEKLRGERGKNESVVVLKRLFKPEEFDTNPGLVLEYAKDLREECSKFGPVKVAVFDRHEEGVATLKFRDPAHADECIRNLHGRWFAGKKITAETWDGVTNYRKQETEEEKAERLKKWAEFLAGEATDSEPEQQNE